MPLPQVQTNLPSLIGDAIRDRFYKQQLDMFMQNEYAEYQSELNNLTGALADPSDPDMASKILQSYKASTNKMLVNATRYAKNPYIAQLAKSHFEHDMSQFKGIVDLASSAMETTAKGGKTQAEVDKLKAETELAKQRGLKAEAETAALQKKAEPVQGFFDYVDLSTPARVIASLNRVDNEGLNKRRQTELDQVRQGMAGQLLAERTRTKQINPATGMPWGQSPGKGFDELNQILGSGEITNEQVRQIWEMQTLQKDFSAKTGMIPEQIMDMFPQYPWPKATGPEEVVRRGSLKNEDVGQLVLGKTYDAIIGEGVVPKISDMAKKLPNDLEALQGSPVHDLFAAVANENGGNPETNTPFNNYTEYRAWLRSKAYQYVNESIGGANIPDAELDAETAKSRQKARAFMDQVIDKYAANLGRYYRIPKTPDAPTGPYMGLVPEPIRKGIGGLVERVFGEETIGTPISEAIPGVRGPREKKPASKPPAAPSILNTERVMVNTLDNVKQSKYFRALQAFEGDPDYSSEWDTVGVNSDGDLIIKNKKTGKLSLAVWEGSAEPVTGLKPKKKKK